MAVLPFVHDRWDLARFTPRPTARDYAREALRAKVAEQYNIPRSEAHRRILEDLGEEGRGRQMEERRDERTMTTDFRAHVHAVRPVEQPQPRYQQGWPPAPVPFQWRDYQPAVVNQPGTHYVITTTPNITFIPNQTYTWSTSLTNNTNNPMWQNWTSTSIAATTLTYRVADQVNWAAWNTNMTLTKAYKNWWAEGDASFNIKRDARGKIIVPDGQVYDDRTGDIIDIEVWEVRQVERELAATRLREEQLAATMARDIERAMADKRAVELLMSVLDSRQQKQYQDTGGILVVTPKGRHVQLNNGWGGNAVEKCARTGKPLKRFCIHPQTAMPDADNVLLQKLLLETDEDKFFETAYTTNLVRV